MEGIGDDSPDGLDVLDLDQVEEPHFESSQHRLNCLVGKLQADKSANSYAILDVMKKD